MSSFLNNSELTEGMKIKLSDKLGVTQTQVMHFFQTQSKNQVIFELRHPQNYCKAMFKVYY